MIEGGAQNFLVQSRDFYLSQRKPEVNHNSSLCLSAFEAFHINKVSLKRF